MAKKKVKTVEKCEEKYAGHKGPFPGMEVKTPYPKKRNKIEMFLASLNNLF